MCAAPKGPTGPALKSGDRGGDSGTVLDDERRARSARRTRGGAGCRSRRHASQRQVERDPARSGRSTPSVAAHGGHIAAERVENARVLSAHVGRLPGLRGLGRDPAGGRGADRCARRCRSLREIVDVTDHDAGAAPFYYAREAGPDARALDPAGAAGGAGLCRTGRSPSTRTIIAPQAGADARDAAQRACAIGDVVGVTEAGPVRMAARPA